MGESSWRMPSMLPLALVAMAGIIIIAGGTIRILDAGESCPIGRNALESIHL